MSRGRSVDSCGWNGLVIESSYSSFEGWLLFISGKNVNFVKFVNALRGFVPFFTDSARFVP